MKPLDFKAMELEELLKKKTEISKQLAEVDKTIKSLGGVATTKSQESSQEAGRIAHLELD